MSKVRAEQYTNRLGTGAPEIPYGVTVPEGASIDGAGGLNLTGIATAGTFKGNLTGDVSGNVTGVAATFTGPVTIGGTLTYEDVTNVDSIGVITARSGIVATGVITATSFSGSGAGLTGIDALPSVSGTASGAITANRAVVLKNDGTYEQVVGVNQNMGGVRTYMGDPYRVIAGAYNPDLSNFALLYQDSTNSNYTTSVVGSISGDTITFGTPQVVRSENPGMYTMAINYDPTENVYIGFTRNGNTSYKGRSLLGTPSGTSISWVDDTNINWSNFADARYYNSTYNSNNTRHALVYANSSYHIFIGEGLVKANPPGSTNYYFDVVGSGTIWNNVSYDNPQICYDSTNDCYLVAVSQNTNNYGVVRVVNNTTAAASQWNVGNYRKPYGIEHDPNAGQTCILFNATNTQDLYLVSTVSVNKNTGVITAGTEVKLNDDAVDGGGTFQGAQMTFDPNAKKFVITYCKANFTGVITASVNSAGVITKQSTMQINTTNFFSGSDVNTMSNVFNSNVNKTAVVYRDFNNMIGNGNNAGFARAVTSSSSNLTADKYIGFAAESVTNGQNVKVKTKSNTVTQAGLTTASRYYVQGADGTVGSTASTPSVDVGISLNSNTVLLQ